MTNKNYQRIYFDTIEKLKSGQRPQIKLTPELLMELKAEWEQAIESNLNGARENETIKKILCILDNSQNTTSELNEQFIKTFKQVKDSELLVYLLSASQKHVIADALKSGKMISMDFFDILKTLLQNKNPEIKEWTLRTIESMGPLSMRLRQEVLKAKPGLMKFFNQHQKTSAELVDFLEKEWKRMM